jgi:hypothetical protein
MKPIIGILFLACLARPASGQGFTALQLLLDWQKLAEEKKILTDLYDGYQLLSKGYTTISDLSKGSFDLHKAFLDGLLAVSPAVKSYHRVTDIIQAQQRILSQYKSAWGLFRQDPHFSAAEIAHIGNVYAGLFDRSVKNLSDLTAILTDRLFRASDAERLDAIDGLYEDMNHTEVFLNVFNNRTALLSLQRSADLRDYESVRELYGLNN